VLNVDDFESRAGVLLKLLKRLKLLLKLVKFLKFVKLPLETRETLETTLETLETLDTPKLRNGRLPDLAGSLHPDAEARKRHRE